MKTLFTIMACFCATFASAQTTLVHDGTPSGTAVGKHAIINQGTPVTPSVPKTQPSTTPSTKTNQGYPVNQPKQPIAVPQKKG
jgi:hypothetical protein